MRLGSGVRKGLIGGLDHRSVFARDRRMTPPKIGLYFVP